METKDTLSSCSDSEEQEIQQLQKQAKILKENSLNKLNALQTTTQHLSSSNHLMYYTFRDAFHRLFEADERTFRSVLSRNIQNLERQLNKETLHEKDSNSDLRVIKVQFDKFIHSKVLEPSNYNSYDLETRRDFKEYTHMEAQTFKETIIQNMNSIEQCIVERANHEQELQNGLKRLNERKLQIQECKVQKVKASDASSGDNDCSRIVLDKENDQGLENQSNTSGDESSRSRNECNDKSTSRDDTDIRPSYDIEPMIKKANASLTQELTECKSILTETSRTLGESNSVRDSYLVALQNKQTEFKRYKAFNDRTDDYDKLEHKLNKTLGLLAQKEIDIKEGLKVKACEILVVKEKHDELVKQSLLTKSHYEGLVKEKQRELVNQAWVKHSKDHFRAPTAQDMEILIKTCLMPLALKTQNDSFAFVHELKKEMHADLKLNPLKMKLTNLNLRKQNFQTYAHAELQCLYDHKVKECECLAQKLSKQTESVSKEVYTKILRSFAKLEKYLISLELALQQCQEDRVDMKLNRRLS
ncbi:hypothetical protein Tco_0218174 [Tanacetum coccineum]